uniref:Uncharacterized protein n=1 Tax=Triticum urartu TaxID=4572 RepID=A0A8R7TVN0_TRIUA
MPPWLHRHPTHRRFQGWSWAAPRQRRGWLGQRLGIPEGRSGPASMRGAQRSRAGGRCAGGDGGGSRRWHQRPWRRHPGNPPAHLGMVRLCHMVAKMLEWIKSGP